MDDRHADLNFAPATFALHAFRYDDEQPEVVGWGMTLPDGTAVAIGWRDGAPGGLAICGGVAGASFVFDAEVCWTPEG